MGFFLNDFSVGNLQIIYRQEGYIYRVSRLSSHIIISVILFCIVCQFRFVCFFQQANDVILT